MEKLPSHLIDEMLFRLPHKSLARLKCANRSFRSHISNPEFESEYLSRVGSGLLHVSSFGSTYICYLPFVSEDPQSPGARAFMPIECQILGSLGGLVLLFMKELCVVNPITKQFRFLGYEDSEVIGRFVFHDRGRHVIHWKRSAQIGFAVEQIDRSSQSFKVVCINEVRTMLPDGSRYEFEIHAGDSWRKSRTSIACPASNLCWHMKPVYFNGYLHWLRTDGSIIAFNPGNEQARIIQTNFLAPESGVKTWFGAVNGQLTLVSATEEEISVFALRDLGVFADWAPLKRIKNGVLEEGEWLFWSVVVYDGRFLVLHETKQDGKGRTVHGYDVVAGEWTVLGETPTWTDSNRDFFCFAPSCTSVKGLESWQSTAAEEMEAHELFPELVNCVSVFMELFDRICR